MLQKVFKLLNEQNIHKLKQTRTYKKELDHEERKISYILKFGGDSITIF
jgi:hypothetical protein